MNYKSPEFKKWLDKLQQESWQLELLISGFAIFGLFSAFEPLQLKFQETLNSEIPELTNIWGILNLCCSILIF